MLILGLVGVVLLPFGYVCLCVLCFLVNSVVSFLLI